LDKLLYFISLEVFVKVAEISYTFRDLGVRHKVDEKCPLMGYYAASSGNSLPTFWDNLSTLNFLRLKMGPTDCPKTSVRITTTHCIMAQKITVLFFLYCFSSETN
jgi:hypothetical protein